MEHLDGLGAVAVEVVQLGVDLGLSVGEVEHVDGTPTKRHRRSLKARDPKVPDCPTQLKAVHVRRVFAALECTERSGCDGCALMDANLLSLVHFSKVGIDVSVGFVGGLEVISCLFNLLVQEAPESFAAFVENVLSEVAQERNIAKPGCSLRNPTGLDTIC